MVKRLDWTWDFVRRRKGMSVAMGERTEEFKQWITQDKRVGK